MNSARRGDFLDELIDGSRSKEFMTQDAMIQLLLISLLASFESVSTVIVLLLTLISGNDRVVQDLRVCQFFCFFFKINFKTFNIKMMKFILYIMLYCRLRMHQLLGVETRGLLALPGNNSNHWILLIR